MESDNLEMQDPTQLSDSARLRIFTKMLREPVVVSGSAYRSGAHPILATKVAAEVARSPKVGLVQKLMEESRDAFVGHDYPTAIVKSLAAEELLRKYGGILAPNEESDIRDQLHFLKVQYFLLSGQAGEAFKFLKNIRFRSHPYLWHKRLAQRSGVSSKHWTNIEHTLRIFFSTNKSGKIFALLGYAIVMGPHPSSVANLATELDYQASNTERPFEALYQDYSFLTTRVTQREKDFLPQFLASEFGVTPLIKEGNTLFIGVTKELSERNLREIEVRTGAETVMVPMSKRPLRDRNMRLYAS
jgi:hypothetical protein